MKEDAIAKVSVTVGDGLGVYSTMSITVSGARWRGEGPFFYPYTSTLLFNRVSEKRRCITIRYVCEVYL